MNGPLHGYRVVELAGIGPGPFAGMLLADMGADVVRIDRPRDAARGSQPEPQEARFDVLGRGRRSVAVDLKHPEGPDVVLRLAERADALLEGFRPGVTERLGVGPAACFERNPRLVYGRMTGWGQSGPLAQAAGRDVNYIALSGTLAMIGRRGEAPVPPLTLLGDFGGGGLLLAFGLACAMLEAARSGQGQVVDAAMLDGTALLAAMFQGLRAAGDWPGERGTNLLDTGAYFYEVYETADGRYISLGALDTRSHELLVRLTGLTNDDGRAPDPDDRAAWPSLKTRLAALRARQDPGRVVSVAGGYGRLLRTGARARRGSRPPAQSGAGHVRRGRWSGPVCACASVQPHGSRHSGAAAEVGRALRRDPGQLGLLARRDLGPPRVRRRVPALSARSCRGTAGTDRVSRNK